MKTLDRIRVLIVEDDPLTLEALTTYLRDRGHDAWTAGNGLGAQVALAAFHPDVMVVDHLMPAQNGLDLVTEMRAGLVAADTPVVLITALADGPELKALEQRLAAMQPACLLRKPFEPCMLLDAILAMPRSRVQREPDIVSPRSPLVARRRAGGLYVSTPHKPPLPAPVGALPPAPAGYAGPMTERIVIVADEIRVGPILITKTEDGGAGIWFSGPDGNRGPMIALFNVNGQAGVGIYSAQSQHDAGGCTICLTVGTSGEPLIQLCQDGKFRYLTMEDLKDVP